MSPSRDDEDPPKRAPLRSITNRVPDRVRTWRTVPKVGLSTPASVSRTTFRMSLPETEEGDRCLALEKVLHYSGGSALLLEGGSLALYASGSTLVVTEVESEGTSERKTSGAGLWGLFPTVNKERSHGRQAFLFGHSQPVVHLRVSVSNKFLISAEKDSKALLIVWNIFASGAKKVAAFRPFDGGIRCIALNENDSLLCVVGWDKCRRLLLIIFDLHALLRDKIGITPPSPTKSPVIIAKQVSDFDVADIIFSSRTTRTGATKPPGFYTKLNSGESVADYTACHLRAAECERLYGAEMTTEAGETEVINIITTRKCARPQDYRKLSRRVIREAIPSFMFYKAKDETPEPLPDLVNHVEQPVKGWTTVLSKKFKKKSKRKIRLRGRWVGGGHRQKRSPILQERNAPTARSATHSLLLAIASKEGRKLQVGDIPSAYLQADHKPANGQHVHIIADKHQDTSRVQGLRLTQRHYDPPR